MERNQGIQEYLSKLSYSWNQLLPVESHQEIEATADIISIYQEAERELG